MLRRYRRCPIGALPFFRHAASLPAAFAELSKDRVTSRIRANLAPSFTANLMPVEDDDLIFNGNSSTEAERFLFWVRRKARSEGKARDQEWILDLVDGCLGGSALRWYLTLDPTVRNSWDSLQLAILNKWSDVGESDISTTIESTVPTPAAAPQLPEAMPPPPRAVARSGRIRVIGALAKTYLSRVLEGDGDIMTCTDKQEALQVTFIPSEKPHAIEVLNMRGPHRWLGVQYSGASPADIQEQQIVHCVRTTGPGSTVSSTAQYSGIARCEVWNVSSGPDGSVAITWEYEENGVKRVLSDVVFCEEKKWALPVVNSEAFMKRSDLGSNVYRDAVRALWMEV